MVGDSDPDEPDTELLSPPASPSDARLCILHPLFLRQSFPFRSRLRSLWLGKWIGHICSLLILCHSDPTWKRLRKREN